MKYGKNVDLNSFFVDEAKEDYQKIQNIRQQSASPSKELKLDNKIASVVSARVKHYIKNWDQKTKKEVNDGTKET